MADLTKNRFSGDGFGDGYGAGAEDEAGAGFEGHPHCVACQSMMMDALDETLGPVDRVWFERHTQSCVECAAALSEAQRGSAWLQMLKSPRPEPRAELLERLLAQAGALDSPVASGPELPLPTTAMLPFLLPQPVARPVEVARRTNLLSFPVQPAFAWNGGRWARTLMQPRLMMTAAMAFFSIALTLNLSGVRLDQVRAADLTPNSLERNLHQANARAVRYCDNLRVVELVEARVDDLRTDDARSDPRRSLVGDTSRGVDAGGYQEQK